MPEEKIGTKVELDISELLKRLDQLNAATKKQKESWDSWLGAVERRYPTLDKVSAAIEANTNRLNELRFSEEKATTVVKEEIEIRRKLLVALKQLQAAHKGTETVVEKHTRATGRNLKKMLLWGAGAASAYRLYRKLVLATKEFIQEVIKGTVELDDMTAASLKLKAGLAAAFSDEILGGVRSLTDVLTKAEGAVEHYTTQWEANAAVIDATSGIYERTALFIGSLLHPIEDVVEIMGLEVDYFQELTNAQERYTAGAQEFIDKTREQADASNEAAKAYERYQQRLYKITETRLQGLLQAHRDYYDALADMALDDARRAEDLAIETARRQEDWARDAARRRAALLRQYSKQVLQAERNYARARERLADDRARRLLEIERRYQDRLLEIERTYSQSMYEAIAGRDATAALRAMRQRRENLADAKRDRDRARADVESDYARRLRELRENLEEQRRQARRSYEEALEELNRSLREQEEDLAISLRRQEEDAALSRERQLQDLKRSLAEQMQAVQDQYKRDRALAEIEYRFRERAFMAHLARMQLIAASYQAAFQAPAGAAGGGQWPGVQRFAEGGAMVATGPTMALFGERGPELVIAQPLAPAPQSFMVSGSVRHEVSTIIQQSMAGFEGRIAGAVHSALAEVIR